MSDKQYAGTRKSLSSDFCDSRIFQLFPSGRAKVGKSKHKVTRKERNPVQKIVVRNPSVRWSYGGRLKVLVHGLVKLVPFLA